MTAPAVKLRRRAPIVMPDRRSQASNERRGPVVPRLVVAGFSQEPVCGVRDHAMVLSAELEAAGIHVSTVWAQASSADLGRWTIELCQRSHDEHADAVLLHYSVFAFSRHGVPSGVPLLAARLRRLGIPVVLFAHELAFPWGRRGWRGTLHAAAHRAALVPLIAACDATVVTTPGRVDWLRTRWWLPRRPVTWAPVFSTISPHSSVQTTNLVPGRIGLFSFGGKGLSVELITDAVADVAARVPGAHLVLIGAPGPGTPAGEHWRRAAIGSNCPLAFTGHTDAAGVSREIAACAVMVHPDPGGPSSRKTSLAASLAHGKAVVALDGPHTWRDLATAGALALVEPTRGALASEISRLLLDPVESVAAGSSARKFYETRLRPETTVDVVLSAFAASISTRDGGDVSQGSHGDAPSAVGDHRPAVTLVAQEVHDHGGMERACAELIRHTHGQVRFTVVAVKLDRNLLPLVERWVRVRVPRRPYALKFLIFFVRAGSAVARNRSDLVHTVGAIVPNRVDMATVHFCHAGFREATGRLAPMNAIWMRRVNTALARALALAAERWSFRVDRVRTVAAVSEGVVKEISTHYPELPMRLTPNGVDVNRFRPDTPDRERMRSEQQVGEGTCVALFVGGDWDHKGLGLAVEGVAKARAEGADIVLWVVGKGDEARLRMLARGLAVEAVISFFGRRNDTERFYRAADLFVLPSAYETFSIVCFEAAACGLPLVIPALSGAGDLVGDDEGGLIIDRNTGSIAAALGLLARDPPRRLALGQVAQRRASQYTWASSASSVVDAYRSLLLPELAELR